jgi:hypothetical protein
MKLLAALILVVGFTAGCATDPNPVAQTSQSLAVSPGAPYGVVVGSVGHESSTPFAASHVAFRSTDAAGGGVLIYQPKYMVPSPKDFETDLASGTVVVAKLPPGNYSIVRVGAMWHAGMMRFTPSLPLTSPISFTVKAGTVTYLGRYLLGRSGRSPNAQPFLRIENNAESDMKIATQRNPDLASLSQSTFTVPVGRLDP